MSAGRHTPGPWFVTGRMTKYVESRIGGGLIQEVASVGPTNADNGYGEQQEANARLIAAAPDLLEVLDKMLNNEEQRAFENWFISKAPSGDCSDVQAQWLESSDYEDFLESWKLQIAAIVPVINRSMTERISKKRIYQECIDACELAGCPIDLKLLEQE